MAPTTCHSSRVPITAASTSQVAGPARSQRRHSPGSRRPWARSRTASATSDASTQISPSVIAASFRVVGAVMKRVSMSTRAERPGCGGTLRSVKIPATCGFFSGASVPVAPGMPMKSAPDPPGPPHRCSALQPPALMAGRGATAATVSRNATTTVSALARTNRPLRLASIPAGGMVENTRPPGAGSVAIAVHGMDTSSASGAPETSGAVMSLTRPSARGACGQRMVAVVCLTGSNGTSTHSATPTMPATTATSRAILVGSALSLDTSLDVRRRR